VARHREEADIGTCPSHLPGCPVIVEVDDRNHAHPLHSTPIEPACDDRAASGIADTGDMLWP
jgi:hypothetical protein